MQDVNDYSTQTSGASLPPDRPWRLVRGADEKLAGVCAGLAAASGVDVTLVRLAFVLAGLSGFGIIAYVVLAIVVPKQDVAGGEPLRTAPTDTARWIRVALGVGAVVGLIGTLDDGPLFFGGPDDGAGFVLGLTLCIIGAVIFWNRRGRQSANPGAVPPWSTPRVASPTAAPAPATGSVWAPPAPTDPGPSAPWSGTSWPLPGDAPGSAQPTEFGEPTTVLHPHMPAAPPPVDGPSSPTRPGRRPLGASAIIARVIAWLVVIAAVPVTIAVVAVVRIDALSVPWSGLFLGLAVGAIVHLVVWASAARSAGPVFAAIAALLGVAGVTAAVSHWNGEIGERYDTPTARSEIPAAYELAIGHQVVDLSELVVSGDPLTVNADVAIGLLEVVVPDDVTVQVDAEVTGGSLQILGVQRDGLNTDVRLTDGTDDQRRYVLDLDVGYGEIQVCRVADAEMADGQLQCRSVNQ